MRPCGPVPVTVVEVDAQLLSQPTHQRRSTDRYLAPRSGARYRPLDHSSVPPITTSTVPTGTISPSPTKIFATVPAAGDGISTVVLSVAISTSGSSSAISWPSLTSHRAISPSVSPSPRSGSLNS